MACIFYYMAYVFSGVAKRFYEVGNLLPEMREKFHRMIKWF